MRRARDRRRPEPEDAALVRAADREGVPIVLVQLWPQADWSEAVRPLAVRRGVPRRGKVFRWPRSPAGSSEAAEHAAGARRARSRAAEAVERAPCRHAVARAAAPRLLGLAARPGRPLIALEQMRMLASPGRSTDSGVRPELAAGRGRGAASLGAGFAFRGRDRRPAGLPAPRVNAAVAAAGTWALAKPLAAMPSRGSKHLPARDRSVSVRSGT